MKNILILLVMFNMTSYGQDSASYINENASIMDCIDYYDVSSNLDEIEGIWQLNVVRTLVTNNRRYIEREDNYSEWLIVKTGHNKYDVRGVRRSHDEIEFEAFFTKVNEDEYTYHCTFLNPEWKVATRAFMTDGNKIQYGYFADQGYVKRAYGKDYKKDMTLHWVFTWVKIYPKTVKS